VTQFAVNGSTYAAGATATIANVGSLVINADGSFIFTPVANYNGAVPTVTYTVADQAAIDTNGEFEGLSSSVSRNTHNAVLPSGWTPGPITPDTFNASTTFGNYAWTASPDGGDFLHAIANDGASEGFSQVLTGLVPGQTYTVAFSQSVSKSNFTGAVGSQAYWQVGLGGVSQNADPLATPGLGVAAGWQTQSLTFTATAATQTLSFLAVNATPGQRVDLGIDGITVTGVSSAASLTASAALDITVTPVNDAPDAVADSITVPENGPAAAGDVTPGTSGQDSDIDGDTLTVTQVNGAVFTPGTAITLPSAALLTMNADGTYSYDPNGAFESVGAGQTGTDGFTYQVADGKGGFDTATVTITINGQNDAPIAIADTNSGTEQQTLSGDLLAGAIGAGTGTGGADTDVDGGALTITALSFGSVGIPVVLTHGKLTINSNGSYTFVPSATANTLDQGQVVVEQVTYTVSDGNGGTSQATLTLTLTGQNDAPFNALAIVASSGVDGGTVTIPAFAAFADPDGEALTFTLAAGAPGWLSIDPLTGVISGTPPANASQGGDLSNGVYGVGVIATDPYGASATSIATLTIFNPAPDAIDDIVTTAENTPLSGDVTPGSVGQDSDPDGDVMTVIAVEGISADVGTGVTGSNGGTFTIAANGTYGFDPGTAFDGLAVGETRTTTVSYTISDGEGGTDVATVSVTVSGVNDAPVARDISLTTREDMPVSGRIELTDVDGDKLTVAGPVSGPSNGFVIVNADGTFTYQPRGGYAGLDSFVVQVDDGHGGFDLATVTIEVLEESSIIPQSVALEPDDPSSSPTVIATERFHGMVLDTVDRLASHGDRSIDLSVSGIVLNAVNSVHRLEGATLDLGGGRQDTGPIARITASAALAARAEAAFPMSHGFWDVQALSGYSVRMLAENGSADGSGRIIVDTLMRDRIIFIKISNTLDHARHGQVESYKVL